MLHILKQIFLDVLAVEVTPEYPHRLYLNLSMHFRGNSEQQTDNAVQNFVVCDPVLSISQLFAIFSEMCE